MRPTLCLLAALMLTPLSHREAYGQTWRLLPTSPAAPGNRHEDIAFTTPEVGWLVNLDGRIYRTGDGGATWAQQHRATTANGAAVRLRSVGFANEQLGWAGSLTPDNLLYETRNGGHTWADITHRIEGASVRGICGMWVVNENVAYGVGRYDSPATLIKTTDGGLSWTATDLSAHAATLIDVFFFDEQRGFAVGGDAMPLTSNRAVILATEDGGATWAVRHRTADSGEWGWKISFPTSEIGFVSVEDFFPQSRGAKVLKTMDGGQTWDEMRIDESFTLQGIGFATANIGWASGRGHTSVTTDGGASWSFLELDGRINRFRMFGDTLGYAVGNRVFKFEAPATTATEPPTNLPALFSLEANYPNPFNPQTTIRFTLAAPTAIRLTVHDVLGRRLATLAEGLLPPGVHTASWAGTDDAGRGLPSGLYLYRLTADGRSHTRTMTLIK